MSISFDSALGVHPYALDVRADRARILAGNLANVDTPGYLARDVDYKSILGRVARQVAAGEQGSAISQGETDMQHPLYRIPYQVSMDGNTAELSVEQSKFASNATDFQTSLTFLNMKITGIAKAIEGR
ncbi:MULTISPECIES: lateral flagellar basal body rod protein LfgB [Aeromonas]|jgi:flagellar basal-body rod protein FlgB|uniref:Flagellar basal body rod protein FlgB n=1 Tax=Aeromonas media TaxID=651 RepID=A0AAP6GDE9_AERME|nr:MULTISPECIES: lateral flagellar basal body rod protein LfgB [Aeromonas]AHE51220.1 FlgBL [Aeromonas hydrophila 4AK4]MBP6791839.1 lateral flagellar basal body rod protein LfgB [Aeromonas sp.]MBP8221206.1 lateral flagellar basal body rod protein LfgB [Aeromonadaceae bacterium]MCE9942079.1 lateral flagellar basal body rod protein LfgB [Aeromonas rivipollensis]MDM5058949.1 lateral flagellar basal body rod protein LfgB [Aeromonas rivipollensis]